MAKVYRVIREKYAARPLDTEGSRLYGGRWNPPGVGIMYTAEHAALALVEILVHAPRVPYRELPIYRLFTLEVPDDSIRFIQAGELPAHWNEKTHARSQYILQDWLNKPDVLTVGVPSSVLTPGVNYLIHANHPAFANVRMVEERPLLIDIRLWPL